MIETNQRALDGMSLTEKDVETLEQKLKQDDSNIEIRSQLLGFYWHRKHENEVCRNHFEEHALWIIQTHPMNEIASTTYVHLIPEINGQEVYNHAKKLWLAHIDADKENITLLKHAAKFFILDDSAISEFLLTKAKNIDPDNPYWLYRLANLYRLEARKGKMEFSRALENYERAFKLADQDQKFYYFLRMPATAFNADEFKKGAAFLGRP